MSELVAPITAIAGGLGGLIESDELVATLATVDQGDSLSSTASLELEAILSVSEQRDQLTSSASIPIDASFVGTDQADSLTAAAAITIEAALILTEQRDSLTSLAVLQIEASFSAQDQNDTLNSDVSIGSGFTASLEITESRDTVLSESALTIEANLSTVDQRDTLSADVTVALGLIGSLSIVEQGDTLISSTVLEIAASLFVTESRDILSSSGGLSLSGDFSAIDGYDTLSASANVGFAGSLSITEGRDTLVSDAALGTGRRAYVIEKQKVFSQSPPQPAKKVKKPKIGSPLQAEIGTHRMPLVGTPVVSPKEAASNILAAYLKMFVFEIKAGTDGKASRFRLNEVLAEWPTPGAPMNCPCGSISEGVVTFEDHNLTPTMIEDSVDCYGAGTVLWKTGEISVRFQVDFWLTSAAAREAVQAGLPRMFSPTEVRSGVMLAGDPDYFDRSVRATYIDSKNIDISKSTYERERRLTTTILCDMDVVHLRGVTRLHPQSQIDTTDNS